MGRQPIEHFFDQKTLRVFSYYHTIQQTFFYDQGTLQKFLFEQTVRKNCRLTTKLSRHSAMKRQSSKKASINRQV